MAKRRPLVPIKFQVELPMLTAANNGGVATTSVPALEQSFDVISTHLQLSIRNGTVGEGPIEVGLGANTYTIAEIIEALDASPLQQYGPEMERSKRSVRSYGAFSGNTAEETLNDGKPIKRKMFLRLPPGVAAAKLWAVNRSGATLTTGTVIEISGVHWGRWK